MSAKPSCEQLIWSPDYFRGYPCSRPAKWLVRFNGKVRHLCGVHVRRWRSSDALIEELS